MPRPTKDFAHLNTTSKRKLELIKNQIEIVNARYSPKSLKGYCVGLPGAGKQTKRHRDEYCLYGIPERRQVMVDYDPYVHNTQKQYMKKLNYKGKIIEGDYFHVVKDMWAKNKQIDIIDFDGVSHLTKDHEELIKNAAKNNVKVIIMVVTNRCNKLSEHLTDWKKKLGLRKRRVRNDRKPQEPVKDIQIGAVKALARKHRYDVYYESYQGHGSPMLGFVLLRK